MSNTVNSSLRSIWVIAQKELNTFFDALIAYVLFIVFLGFTGFFTWIYGGNDIFFLGQASLQAFFDIALWTLFFFIPALTMRLIAEEKKSGTIELLLTKRISSLEIILGKFLGSWLLIGTTLLFTLSYYLTISRLGNIDHGATLCGYLGLLMMSATYISIGIFASSLTNNQIIAFLLAIVIGIFFHLIFGILANGMTGWLGDLLHMLSLSPHFESMSRGVIDTKDLVYFSSIVALFLYLATLQISKR